MGAAILTDRRAARPAAGETMDPSQRADAPDDEALLARVRAGDGVALAHLIERYRRPLHGYLLRLLRENADAEDVFQETFLRVVKNVERFEAGRKVRPWLYAIATNLVKNVYRSRAVRDHVELDAPAGAEDAATLAASLAALGERPDDEASRAEEAAHVRAAVAALPERSRTALVLFYFQGLRYEEIAVVLEVPLGTVKSRIHHALARLADALKARERRANHPPERVSEATP